MTCQQCIDNTDKPDNPTPCGNCMQNCYCQKDKNWICRFCLNITCSVLKLQNTTEYKRNFPCYCATAYENNKNKPDYLFLCLDCQQDYCTCDNKIKYVGKHKRLYHCPFCFEKEHNQIIEFAIKED